MRLIFAVLACGLVLASGAPTADDVELITEPRPGEEFVLFRSGTVQGRGLAAPEELGEVVEVQTEVSVVTSKNVHVEGVTVRPAATAGVQKRPADSEEALILAAKKAKQAEHTAHKEKPIVSNVAAPSDNIEVKSEAETGVVITPVVKNEYGGITVQHGKFHSSEDVTTTPFPTATRAPIAAELPPPLNVLSKGPFKASEEGGLHSKGVISDAPLVSAGSQPHASRINVKKGPNGQDYEYEYVYYYYDDDSEDANNGTSPDVLDSQEEALPAATTQSAAASSTTTAPVVTTTPAPEKTDNGRRYLPTGGSRSEPTEEELEDDEEPPSRSRVRGWSNAREQQPSTEEPSSKTRSRGSPQSNRVRYTTIERARGSAHEEEEDEVVASPPAASAERPAVNEVVPVRGGNRFRSTTEASELTDRLPPSTRFPPRRLFTTLAPDASSPRAAVRPSLELVDSSSFRTGAATPSADLPSFPAVPGGRGAPVRFLGVNTEDAGTESAPPSRSRGRSTTTTSTSTSTTEAPEILTEAAVTETTPSANSLAVEKAAYDLYAILQQAQDNIQDNVVHAEELDALETTTVVDETTVAPTTTSTAAPSTTSTTPEPSTTVASTTASGSRYRTRTRTHGASGVQHQRPAARPRRPEIPGAVPVTDTSVHHEATTARTRSRFQGSRRGTTPAPAREDETNENEASAITTRPKTRGFRGGNSRSASSTVAPLQAAPAAVNHVRPSFPRRRGFPNHASSTAAPASQESSAEEASSPAVAPTAAAAAPSASAKPRTNPRLRSPVSRPSGLVRSGGRLALPRAGALTTPTTSAPVTAAEVAPQESSGATPDVAAVSEEASVAVSEPSEPQEEEAAITTPTPGTLTRLRNRPRLRITERTSKPQTSGASPAASPASRRQLVSSLLPRRRPSPSTAEQENGEAAPADADSAAREEAETPIVQEAAAPAEAAPPATSAPAPEQQESRLNSLLKKRGRKPGLFPARQTTTAPEA